MRPVNNGTKWLPWAGLALTLAVNAISLVAVFTRIQTNVETLRRDQERTQAQIDQTAVLVQANTLAIARLQVIMEVIQDER